MRIRHFFARSILNQIILIALVASVMPTVTLGISSYWYSAGIVQEEVNQANTNILASTYEMMNRRLQNVQNSTLQMLFNPFFAGSSFEPSRFGETSFKSEIYQHLSALQNSNSDISDVFLYIEDNYLLSPRNGGIVAEHLSDTYTLSEALSSGKAFQWGYKRFRLTSTLQHEGVMFIAKVPLQSNRPYALLAVVIAPEMFLSSLNRSILYDGEQLAIYDAEGQVIASTFQTAGTGSFRRSLYEEGRNGQRYYTDPQTKIEYLVNSIVAEEHQWEYTDFIPLRELNAKSRGIAYRTTAIIAVLLLLGVVASLLSARRIYRPIQRLMTTLTGNKPLETDEMTYVQSRWTEMRESEEQLKQQLNRQLPLLQETFALQLMHGYYSHYSAAELKERFERFHIPYEAAHRLLIITYDRTRDNQHQSFLQTDQELILFSIQNIVLDMMKASMLTGLKVHLLDEHIAVWLWSGSDQNGWDAWTLKTEQFAEKSRAAAASFLRLDVTAAVSPITNDIRHLNAAFQQTMMVLRSRLVLGSNQIIRGDWQSATGVSPLVALTELELQVENALRLGQADKANALLGEFFDRLQDGAYHVEQVRSSCTQLLAACIRAAHLSGVSVLDAFEEKNPFTVLDAIQSLEEAQDWFNEWFILPIAEQVQQKQNREYEDAVQKVVDYIAQHYSEDISLEQCAEMCMLSPAYLSKLFKKMKMTTFIDYLTHYRIERAKTWLLQSDLTINEIARLTGYQPQNLIRVFKKLEGVTPGQYRELHKE
ncbi:AraC family transcriptional regulator [Paenibacillus periandrae]|uniref:AraC family transcriptional regulator n=1 Tax=Paenibacillus periandrae TaxID=1761741 RepID=UPI001F08D5E9|nr:helix-turn-helix domain-containing protein [Paenibacillus periandrae]